MSDKMLEELVMRRIGKGIKPAQLIESIQNIHPEYTDEAIRNSIYDLMKDKIIRMNDRFIITKNIEKFDTNKRMS